MPVVAAITPFRLGVDLIARTQCITQFRYPEVLRQVHNGTGCENVARPAVTVFQIWKIGGQRFIRQPSVRHATRLQAKLQSTQSRKKSNQTMQPTASRAVFGRGDRLHLALSHGGCMRTRRAFAVPACNHAPFPGSCG